MNRVAVLGAGAMGARIAALFAASGVRVLLLDVTEQLARKAQAGESIEIASFEHGIPLLGGADWVVEAVIEDLAIKRNLWLEVAPFLKPEAIASTNTSGLSIAAIAEGLPAQFARQFFGVHFFNPPAVLRLVEVIPTPRTDPELVRAATRFLTERLRKEVIEARDTPNFIANRIGAYFSAAAQSLALEGGWTVEEVDLMTGPLIGMPRTGTFRLMDVIGLDVWMRVMETSRIPAPPFFRQMLSRGWLGNKSGGGFYRKADTLEALDLQTLEYRPAVIPSFHPETLPQLLARKDRTAAFLRALLLDLIAYAHQVAPSIANSPSDLDRAMRWGYGWSLGPFEMEAALP